MSFSLNHLATACICICPMTFEHVLLKLERMVVDPDCNSQLICSLLMSDPMLCALVLSRANCGNPEPTTSLNKAISILGLSGVHGFCEECAYIPQQQKASLAKLWSAANASSIFARIVAAHSKTLDPAVAHDEVAACIGLLHDLGSIVSYHLFDEQEDAVKRNASRNDSSYESGLRTELGLRASDFGALLAKNWHLPTIYSDAMRYHRRPMDCERNQDAACLAHVAHHLARCCGYQCSLEEYVEQIDAEAMQVLGFKDRDLTDCVKAFIRDYQEIALYEGFFATA